MKKLFVIGMAALLLVAFTMPVMAKVKIGGMIFTDFYYLNRDEQNAHRGGYTGSLTGIAIQLPNITRLYARWTNEDNVGMYIELGIGQPAGSVRDQTLGGDGTVSIRHAYGYWDITPAFQILAGHSTTPFSQLAPSQMLGTRSGTANVIGFGYGEYYSGRFAQLRGTFRFGKMGRVEVALADPHGGNLGPWTNALAEPTIHTNSKIPQITVGVPLHFGPVAVYPSVLYQHRTVDNATPAGVNNDLDTLKISKVDVCFLFDVGCSMFDVHLFHNP